MLCLAICEKCINTRSGHSQEHNANSRRFVEALLRSREAKHVLSSFSQRVVQQTKLCFSVSRTGCAVAGDGNLEFFFLREISVTPDMIQFGVYLCGSICMFGWHIMFSILGARLPVWANLKMQSIKERIGRRLFSKSRWYIIISMIEVARDTKLTIKVASYVLKMCLNALKTEIPA